MATLASPNTSYSQTVGLKIDMDDLVTILPVDDVPLQQWIPNGPPATETKVQWLNESLTGQTFTANANSLAASGTVVLTDNTGVRVGDILRRAGSANVDGGVQVVVTAVNVDGVTLTVSTAGTSARPFAGTTDEQISTGDTLELIGQFIDEGADPLAERFVDRTTDFNYTQVSQEKVNATRTTRKVQRYGMDDPYNHEVQKKFRELAIRHERRLVLGRRQQGTGSEALRRSMGGLLYFMAGGPNNVSDVKANLATATNTALRNIYNQGGMVNTIWVSADVKAVFDTLNASPVRTAQSDTGYERIINHFSSSFGSVDIRFSRYIPKRQALLVDSKFVSHRTLDGYFHELLAKTGDATNGQIVAEKSLEVREPKAHAILTVTDA